MNPLSRFLRRLRAFFRKDQLDRAMDAEMRFHLDERAAEHVADGVPPTAARHAAQRKFGGVEQLKEIARDDRGWVWLDQLGQDLRYALRQLRRDPGFATTAILTLALGIGATTAMFSVVHGVLLKALPYDEPGQLVQIWEASRPGGSNAVSPGVFLDWREQATTFEGVAAFTDSEVNFTSGGEPARLRGMRVSAIGLELLRARPLLGRVFAADEDEPGKDKVVVLTEELWRQRFGGDAGILGTSVQFNGQPFTVIGVLPARFLPWDKTEFVTPFVPPAGAAGQRSGHFLSVFARLKPGVTLAQARAELEVIATRIRPLFPDWKRTWGATLLPLQEQMTTQVKTPLLVLLGAVALVLLIACANVANLLMARASARFREMALRGALGAGRGRLLRQLLTESLLLSLLGAMGGLLVTWWSVGAVSQLTAVALPRVQEVRLDWTVLGFAVAVTLLVGLVFGLAPAWQGSRTDLNSALRAGGRGTVEGGRSRLRRGLIVAEVALALVLLIGAGLLLNSFWRLFHVDPGFRPQNALTLQMLLSGPRYPNVDRRTASIDQIAERLAALPGVEAVGAAASLPLGGSNFDTLVTVRGRSDAPVGGFSIDFTFSSPGYFAAMGIPLRQGRLFDARDVAQKSRVTVINEALARQLFPNQNPIGQPLVEGNGEWEIVGVVGDVRTRRLGAAARPMMYRSHALAFSGEFHLVIRTTGEPLALAEPVRRAILGLDSAQPVAQVRTLEAVVGASIAQLRFVAALLAAFAGTALLLAAIGLYGVIAYHVAQRTHEIGVRMALGATRGGVLRLVLKQGLGLSLAGLAVGLVAAFALTRVLATFLFEVSPADPGTFTAVSLLLLLVATAACWLPARRAAHVDPMIALRNE